MFATTIRALTALSILVIMSAILAACGLSARVALPEPTALPAPTIVLTVVPTADPTAAPVADVDIAAIDTFVMKMREAYDVPGAAIALVLPNGRTYTQGYGVRDTGTGAPVSPDTQFAIASVTKSFTALGIMLLVDAGKVDLDASVTTYLPGFRLSDPTMTSKVTVRHLLTHTSGMERNNAATGNPTITRDEIVALAAETPLAAAPGEKHIYSNVNTVAAARIIELVSGQSWEEFTRERILTPLGMMGATLNTAALQEQVDYALPHERDLLAGMVPAAPFEPGAEAPAGGINASASEMLRYLQFQLGDGAAAGARLLTPESLAELQRAQITVEETGPVSQAALAAVEKGVAAPQSLTSDYGYGLYWFNEQFQGHRVVQHDGQAPGYSASASFAPEEGVGVVVLTNATYAFGFVEAVRSFILEELLGLPHTHNLYQLVEDQLALTGWDQASVRAPAEAARSFSADPAQLEALAGSYTNLAGDTPITIAAVDGRTLRMEAVVQGVALNVDLVPTAADAFLINTAPFRGALVQFTADDAGTTLLLQGQPLAQRAAQP